MESRQESMEGEMRKQFACIGNQFMLIETHLAELMNMMKTNNVQSHQSLLGKNIIEEIIHDQPRTFGYVPETKFPVFDGMNGRNWGMKCCKYFALFKILEDQWVDFASLHMTGKVESWISSYLVVNKNSSWNDFLPIQYV